MLKILMKPNIMTIYKKVSLWVEQPKPNVDEGYILLIFILGLLFLLILFVIMQPSPDLHINLLHVS